MTVMVEVEKWAHDGRGIAHIDGKTVFISGALPGEHVEIRYLRRKKDFDEAEVSQVLQASPDRVTPLCPHFDRCGGCALQHIEGHAQLLMKQAQLSDLFSRIGHVTPHDVVSPLSSTAWSYRHKARLSVRWVEKKSRVLIGFREKKNPRYLADIDHCVILPGIFEPIQRALPQLIASLSIVRAIPQIEIAIGEGECPVALVIRIMEPLTPKDEDLLRLFSKEYAVRIFLQPNGPDSVHLFYPSRVSEYLKYTLPIEQGLTFEYSFFPTDFTQINPGMNRKMVNQALQWLELTKEDVVLDLFCGLGNFSLPIAQQVAWVHGVEGSEAMVERAKMNAHYHDLKNCSFSCANLEEVSSLSSFKGLGINKILMDPPRTGALTWVRHIEVIHPERIVYVSCDPATLARDAGILVHEKGYRLMCAGVMDMFPQTTHVESMALFVKKT